MCAESQSMFWYQDALCISITYFVLLGAWMYFKEMFPYTSRSYFILEYINALYSCRTIFLVTLCRSCLNIPENFTRVLHTYWTYSNSKVCNHINTLNVHSFSFNFAEIFYHWFIRGIRQFSFFRYLLSIYFLCTSDIVSELSKKQRLPMCLGLFRTI